MKHFVSAIRVIAVSLALALLGSASLAMASEIASEQQTTFYDVPLRCPSAPQIACGGKAKPVLRALENQAAVAEAWVDRTGTIVATVWKSDSTADQRDAAIDDVASIHELPFQMLDQARSDALRMRFLSRDGWYNKTTADALSGDEARFIAERLVRRLVTRAPSAAAKAQPMTEALEAQLRPDLVGKSSGKRDEKLIAAARPMLDVTEMAAFEEAIKLGLRPLDGEK